MSVPRVIDVHGHYGRYEREMHPQVCQFMSASASEVARRAADCGVTDTVVSPLAGLLPRLHGRAYDANVDARHAVAEHDGLWQWVIVDPRDPRTRDQAAEMLAEARCAGIKLHPEEHGYSIREHGDGLLRFAADHDAVVLTHTGEANSLPEDFVPFADEYPSVALILAHLGHGPAADPTRQVRAMQASRHGNVYADTSSAASILPGLIEWAVAEVGADRLLFGSDTPLYHVANQKARIDHAAVGHAERAAILAGNALRLILKLDSITAKQNSRA